MMKDAKPNSKQGQQIIMLSVLGVAFLGAAIYGIAGSLSKPSAAPEPPAVVRSAQPTGTPDGATPDGTAAIPAKPGVAVAGKPGVEVSATTLPDVSNADPFKPALPTVSANGAAPVVRPEARKPEPAQVRIAEAPRSTPSVSVAPSSPVPAVKIAPPPPPRPQVAVTGIIDSEGGADMALIDLGTEHRIIQLGDMLPGNYQVKRIAMDGVLLVSGTDRYFVALGNKSEGAALPGGNPS